MTRSPTRPRPHVRWGVWCLALLCEAAQAQVYVGEQANGTVVLSYMRSAETPDLLVNAPVEPAPPPAAPLGLSSAVASPMGDNPGSPPVPRLPEQYRALFLKVAREQKVSAPLLAAVAAAESGFNARALSSKGAVGLMQLMPDTARRFNVTDRWSPEQSVRGGAAYLRWLSDQFGADLERVIAAYNAGENAVLRAGGTPSYAETQAYLPRVLRYMKHFSRILGSASA